MGFYERPVSGGALQEYGGAIVGADRWFVEPAVLLTVEPGEGLTGLVRTSAEDKKCRGHQECAHLKELREFECGATLRPKDGGVRAGMRCGWGKVAAITRPIRCHLHLAY